MFISRLLPFQTLKEVYLISCIYKKKTMRVKYEAGRVIFLRVHTSAEIPSAFEL